MTQNVPNLDLAIVTPNGKMSPEFRRMWVQLIQQANLIDSTGSLANSARDVDKRLIFVITLD